MHVLILDDQLELADPIRRLARLHGWQPHFVGSLQELELALHAHGSTALVLINQHPPLTSWELEHRYIVQTLVRVGNNRTQAAKLLGISLRCLQYKLKAYHQGSLGPLTPFDRACEIERSGGAG